MSTPFKVSVHTYREAGWAGTLPLPEKKKWAPPTGTTGHSAEDPNLPQIADWLASPSTGNIALRMPENVLGIDVDAYGAKRGAETLGEREFEWGELPPTYTVTSRSDGISGIRLYRVPPKMAWPGQVDDGIETIHRGHRYAVVWPSVHPEGSIYRWYDPDGEQCVRPPSPDDLPELPDEWLLGLTGGKMADPAAKADVSLDEVSQSLRDWARDGACAQMSSRVDSLVEKMSGPHTASRHDIMRDGLLPVLRLGQTGHAGLDDAYERLSTIYVGSISDRATDTEAAAEFKRLVKGGVEILMADPKPAEVCEGDTCHHDPLAGLRFDVSGVISAGAPTHDQPVALPLEESVPAEARGLLSKQLEARKFSLWIDGEARREVRQMQEMAQLSFPPSTVDGAEFLAQPAEEETYLVDQLLPVNGNATLTAQYKTGKTTMVGELVRSISDGVPFLGRFPVNCTGKVGLFNYEMSANQQRLWLQDLGIQRPDRFAVWNLRGHRLPIVGSAEVERRFVEWLASREIEVWILDPFARAFAGSGSENDNGEVGLFLDTLDIIKRKAGVSSIVLPVHTGRGEMEEGHERARGATRLDDWPDVRWLLTKADKDDTEGDSEDRFFRATGRDVDVDEEKLTFDPDTRRLTIGGWDKRTEKRNHVEAEVLRFVRTNPGLNTKEIKEALGGNVTRISAALHHLVETRSLSVTKEKSSNVYRPFSNEFAQPGEIA